MLSPKNVLKLISYWPPYLLAGIKVDSFDLDQGYVVSKLRCKRSNSNYFGTHFGGSLYSMCDPFYVFLLVQKLGKDYIVWDKSASIDFIKATDKDVTAKFEVTDQQVAMIVKALETQSKCEPTFEAEVIDPEGQVIARVQKRLYVRKKGQSAKAD